MHNTQHQHRIVPHTQHTAATQHTATTNHNKIIHHQHQNAHNAMFHILWRFLCLLLISQAASAGCGTCEPSHHHQVLGLASSATQEDIARAWRKHAKAWHPDVNTTPGATDKFARGAQAFEALSDRRHRQRRNQHAQDAHGPHSAGNEDVDVLCACVAVIALLWFLFKVVLPLAIACFVASVYLFLIATVISLCMHVPLAGALVLFALCKPTNAQCKMDHILRVAMKRLVLITVSGTARAETDSTGRYYVLSTTKKTAGVDLTNAALRMQMDTDEDMMVTALAKLERSSHLKSPCVIYTGEKGTQLCVLKSLINKIDVMSDSETALLAWYHWP